MWWEPETIPCVYGWILKQCVSAILLRSKFTLLFKVRTWRFQPVMWDSLSVVRPIMIFNIRWMWRDGFLLLKSLGTSYWEWKTRGRYFVWEMLPKLSWEVPSMELFPNWRDNLQQVLLSISYRGVTHWMCLKEFVHAWRNWLKHFRQGWSIM